MKNLSLRFRLFSLVAFPLTCLTLAAVFFISKSYKEYNELGDLERQSLLLTQVSKLVNETQKERGSSAGFIVGGMSYQKLLNQRKVNDKEIKLLKKALESVGVDLSLRAEILENLDLIKKSRVMVEEKDTVGRVLKSYTGAISSLTLLQLDVAKRSPLSLVNIGLRVLNSFEEAKEDAGIFRAKMTNVFSKGEGISDELFNDLSTRFYAISTILNMESLDKSKEVDKAVGELLRSDGWRYTKKSFDTFVKNKERGEFKIKPSVFFYEVSKSISIMNEVIGIQFREINEGISNHKADGLNNVIILLLVVGLILILCVILTIKIVINLDRNMAGNVQKLSKIKSSMVGISLQSADLAQSIQDVTIHQTSSIDQATSSINEIAEMVLRNGESIKTAEKIGESNSQAAQDGQKSLSEVIMRMHQINESNKQISEQVNESGSEFSKIIDIIKLISEKTNVINDIVFQTKLLSFNASVEAARAGEGGKGFAVVAEEVGNLAGMSGNAASDISGLLNESVRNVEKIIVTNKQAMEKMIKNSTDIIEEGNKNVSDCEKLFENIVEGINSVAISNKSIAMASKEQDQGVSEIGTAMSNISLITQQNTLTASQFKKSSEVLLAQGSELSRIDNDFSTLLKGKKIAGEKVFPLIEWKDEYEIHVGDNDEQHIILVEYINKFITSVNEDGLSCYLKRFAELGGYVREHFAEEQVFMESFAYPEREAHIKIHTALLKKLDDTYENLKDPNCDIEGIIGFLFSWLVTHILGVDTRYADFYQKKRAKESSSRN